MEDTAVIVNVEHGYDSMEDQSGDRVHNDNQVLSNIKESVETHVKIKYATYAGFLKRKTR